MNAFLSDYKFIPFQEYNLIDLDEAIATRLKIANEAFNHMLGFPNISWDIMASLLYPALYDLNHTWGILQHLQSVDDTPEIRKLHEKFQPLITEFYTKSWQNKDFYQQVKNLQQNNRKEFGQETNKVIANELRDFKLSGVELNDVDQIKFRNIQTELNTLTTKFDQNILDATEGFVKYCELKDLSGVPEDVLAELQLAAQNDGKNSQYKITLQAPSYISIMQYSTNRNLREELYCNYTTRASELGNKAFDNSKLIPQILHLRKEKAKLLGFKDYTELSLFNKMAKDSQQVLDFLYELAAKSKQQARDDLKELAEFALKTDKIAPLEAWDIMYYSELLQMQKYSYSNNELKQYFQLPIVLEGLFKLIYQLYKVEFHKTHLIPTWNKDVTTYEVVANGQTIGYLYCDLYARISKQSGAWMNSAQDRYMDEYIEKLPIAYIICNFAKPLNGKPCLLTFDEVQTLFHEMGHALHHLLTKVNHYSISGISNVEWDAVELPSQFMEYFTWNYLILSTISKHRESGAILPQDLYQKLLSSRFFQSGMQMLRQLEFAIFDMLIHDKSNTDLDSYLELLNNVRKDVAVIFPPDYNRFPQTFSHIFSGGYAAGYYSYKWAEVLATDVFSKFDSASMDQYGELGDKFLTSILANGGLNPMLKNFTEFMGREPKIDALLKYSGITQTL